MDIVQRVRALAQEIGQPGFICWLSAYELLGGVGLVTSTFLNLSFLIRKLEDNDYLNGAVARIKKIIYDEDVMVGTR